MSTIDAACARFNALAEYACRQLVDEFAEAIDMQQYERLRAVFTPDAVYSRPTVPDTLIRGLDAIIGAFSARPASRLTQHLMTNVSIRLAAEDAATGQCRIVLYAGDTSSPEEPGRGRKAQGGQLIGAYRDRYVRTAQGWRIAERLGRVLLHT